MRAYVQFLARPMARYLIGFLLLLALGVAARLLPHPPNFTPIAALALFAGFLFPWRWVALALPVAALLLSDALIGFYSPLLMAVVYLGLTAPLLLRGWLGGRPGPLRVGAAALAGSLFFFVSSNLAVWALSGWYPHTPAGLSACFMAALPFFQYTLAGDLFWSSLLFGAYALATRPGIGLALPAATVDLGYH